MKKPEIAEGPWSIGELDEDQFVNIIEEGIKALDDLHDFYYQGAISDGQSHDAAEDFAQNKTKGLYEALKKAGAQL